MDIDEIRSSIDSLDEELLNAFIERMRLSEQVAQFKVDNKLSLTNKKREQEVLEKAQAQAQAQAPAQAREYERYVQEFFCMLMELSKERQLELYPELKLCEEMRQGSCQRLCLGDACTRKS